KSGNTPVQGTGIGLINLRARLETLYGTNQSIQVNPSPERGVVVRLEIPARRATRVHAPASISVLA
ncbi:MAG TPA: hypothetical protein VFL42_14750, partial [Terriglobales bacterium]|nr:hypothetical protein [Terriglobales bacterium]